MNCLLGCEQRCAINCRSMASVPCSDQAISVDLVRRMVKVRDKDVKLSPKDYELLRVLVQRAGKVLTHKFLLHELWDDLTDAQYLRVYVRQLRKKIEADRERPQLVLTETGVGYRLRGLDRNLGRVQH
jgi:two-component system KDP operon response regulator KdpE